MVEPLWVTTMDVRATYWQLSVSSQHVIKSLTMNPYISLFNLKLWGGRWGFDWASDIFFSQTET